MKITPILSVAAILLLSSYVNNNEQALQNNDDMSNNPFLHASTLPYQTADFAKIKDADFKPAIEEGIKQQLEEIGKIAENPDAPTFDNTLVELEKSGQMLHRVNGVFNLLSGANTDSVLQKVSEEVAPELAAANDAIFLNTKLFKRVEAIYDQRTQLKLDAESNRLVEYYYQKFVLSGANLSDNAKETLKKLNGEDASLEAKYTNQLLAAAKAGALLIGDKAELAGLSDDQLASCCGNCKIKWSSGAMDVIIEKYYPATSITITHSESNPPKAFLKPHGTVQKKVILMIHVLLFYVSHPFELKKQNS